MCWVLEMILSPSFPYSQQEAKEKEEAKSRAKAKREAEKVFVLEGLYHNESVRFCSFSLKINHGITEGLGVRTQGLFTPGVDKIFPKGQIVDILGCGHSVSVTTT